MKLQGTDQIPAEQIKAGGRTIQSEIHKLHNFMCKVSRTVPIYKGERQTDCSNYRGIPLLSTMYKILSNILLSRLTPYAGEITWDHGC